MTESPGGTKTGWWNLGTVLAATSSEVVAYEWLTIAFRLESMVPGRKTTWGDMERSVPSRAD